MPKGGDAEHEMKLRDYLDGRSSSPFLVRCVYTRATILPSRANCARPLSIAGEREQTVLQGEVTPAPRSPRASHVRVRFGIEDARGKKGWLQDPIGIVSHVTSRRAD